MRRRFTVDHVVEVLANVMTLHGVPEYLLSE